MAFALVAALGAAALFARRTESTANLARFHGGRMPDFVHNYLYLKWTSTYLRPVRFVLERPHLMPGWLYRRAGNRLMQTHHGKVITSETAKRLVDVRAPINVTTPEQVLPFERARDIILENSDHIAVVDCPCRQLKTDPCQPTDVCFVLGEAFVDFVVDHKKKGARRLTVEEATGIMEREHARGRVHTAWFKDVAGDRLYSICNCCGCCCLGLNAISHGFSVVVSSGYAAALDTDACELCGSCADACHFGAIEAGDEVAIDAGKCKGCGVCVDTCPSGALSLVEDPGKPGPLALS